MALVEDVMSLHDIYDVPEAMEKEIDEELKGNLREVRLVTTAFTLSKIANKYSKGLRLINIRYPTFCDECLKIAEEEEKGAS